MPYPVYKVIHLMGIVMTFMALGGLALQALSGSSPTKPAKKWAMINHGLGLFLVLLGGFGLLARIGITGSWPLWVWLKLGIWLLLGLMTMVLSKTPQWAKVHWLGLLGLVGLAAALANFKP
jgi:hypothetical protein